MIVPLVLPWYFWFGFVCVSVITFLMPNAMDCGLIVNRLFRSEVYHEFIGCKSNFSG